MSKRTSAYAKGTTAAQHDFARVPGAQIPRSQLDRSCGLKTCYDAGYLIPIFVDEALPGDTMNLRMSMMSRLNTPLYVPLENMFVDIHFFSIPYRIVWDNFVKFCGEQTDPGDSTAFTLPIFQNEVCVEDSLSDYMGINPAGGARDWVSLFHRAYNLVWNTWFRSQDLQDSVVVDTDDGPDTLSDYVLLKRGKRHDYFTSCLPAAQKGVAVEMPLGTSAPVVSAGDGKPTYDLGTSIGQNLKSDVASTNTIWSAAQFNQDAIWNDPKLEANLSGATAATINQLRENFAIQRMLERDQRGGTRYTEVVRNHFGTHLSDLQWRPEFLGGGTVRINVNPVASTFGAGVGLGDLASYATAQAGGIGFVKSFPEHCIVLGLVSARADLTYQQGVPRMFSRETRYDMYWPALSRLGEQAVKSKEIWSDGTAGDEDVFGYQERYSEYKYKPSMCTSTMRSDHSASLDAWHLAQDFASRPLLNDVFIQEDPPFDRILQVPAEPHFKSDFWFAIKHARPMPVYSVPGLIDHF